VVKVDVDGIQARIAELPVIGANYRHLVSVANRLYYLRRKGDDKGKLCVYDLEKQKETELADVAGYEISADTKKILVVAEWFLFHSRFCQPPRPSSATS